MFTQSDLIRSKESNNPTANHGHDFLAAMENFARVNKANMRGARLSKRERKARNAFAHGGA